MGLKHITIEAQGFLKGISPLGIAEILQKVDELGIQYYSIPDAYRGVLHIMISQDIDSNIVMQKLAEIDKPAIKVYVAL